VFSEKRSAFGGNYDNYILIPVSAFVRAYGTYGDRRGGERSVNITVRARSPQLLEEAIEETRAILRAERGLTPRDEDSFFIFTNDSQIRAFNRATAGVKAGAFVLGIVALLVAGIGIMNIMLVSVTERTREIGLRKALGATRHSVLLQFLIEAVVLCNIGGVLGVIVGFALGNVVTFFTELAINIPMAWAVRGVVFCSIVGLVFGMWPAVRASRLVPIDALRYE
jgi:putative ABC transport system permease protein